MTKTGKDRVDKDVPPSEKVGETATQKAGGDWFLTATLLVILLLTWGALGIVWQNLGEINIQLSTVDGGKILQQKNADVDTLKKRVVRSEEWAKYLDERVKVLEKQKAIPPFPVEDIIVALGQLKTSISGHPSYAQGEDPVGAEPYATIALVQTISDRLIELEKSVQGTLATREQSTYGPAMLALLKLREQLRSGQPYSEEMQMLQSLTGDDAEMTKYLTELEVYLRQKVPGLPVLQREFSSLIPMILQADREKDGNNTGERLANALSRMVVVQRTDEGTGPKVDVLLKQAEQALQAGDVAAAAVFLARLEGPAARVASGWYSAANRYLGAQKAVQEMYNHLSQRYRRAIDDQPPKTGSGTGAEVKIF